MEEYIGNGFKLFENKNPIFELDILELAQFQIENSK